MASRAQLSFVSGYTPAGNVSLAFAGASDFCVAFAVVVVLSVVVVDLAVAAGVVFAAVVFACVVLAVVFAGVVVCVDAFAFVTTGAFVVVVVSA